MIDFFQNPFGVPAGRAASTDPFGALRPEDRWRLASDKVLGSNLGRRILGLPDRKPDRNRGASAVSADDAPPGSKAAWDFGASYEAIPGWRVPTDSDLKDLGREALDNARRAEERPDLAGQVRTAERVRRAGGAPGEDVKPSALRLPAASLQRKGSSSGRVDMPGRPQPGHASTGAEGVFGVGRTGGIAGPSKAQPKRPESRQPQTGHGGWQPPTGFAGALTSAQWRALAGQLLQTREVIKQTSIRAERDHGDDRQAHDDAVAAAARREDAGLPGFTEHATVLSARGANEKYRRNRENQAAGNGDRNASAGYRKTFETLFREGRHALRKAETALRAGDRPAADEHKRNALLFFANARAAQDDAAKAGVVLTAGPGLDPGPKGEASEPGNDAGQSDSAVASALEDTGLKNAAPTEKEGDAGSSPPDGSSPDRNGGRTPSATGKIGLRPDGPARKPRRAADRKAPVIITGKEALDHLERQFVSGPGPLGASPNRRILAAATAAYPTAEARDVAVRNAIRRAWRGKPAMQRKLIEAARAAAAGASEAERKRLFLEAASGTTVDRTVKALTETENRRVRRINEDRAGAAFEAWRRANPEASETERLNRAVDLALGYGAAPEALKTTVLRHISQKRGVLRDRRGAMSVADAEATWNIYAALGRLYRHDPKMAKALFPGIHGFVAESVAANRFGWDEAASDPAARTAILKRIYLDADKKSFEAHKHGLYMLPWVGPVLAAPDALKAAVETAGHIGRGAWDRIDPADIAAAAALPFGAAGLAKGAQSARRGKRSAGGDRTPRDPDGDVRSIDWSEHESTARYLDEVAGNARWSGERAINRQIPVFGAGSRKGDEAYFGKRIDYDDGRPGATVGEVRLYRDEAGSYAIRPDGERVDIKRLPRNATRTRDGGWVATVRAADGTEITIYYNPHGLPEFPARGAFWLPAEVVKKKPRQRTAYVRSQLRGMAHNDKDSLLQMGFTMEQIQKIKRGSSLTELGLEIHHDYRVGRMLIVDRNLHRLAHIGGRSLW